MMLMVTVVCGCIGDMVVVVVVVVVRNNRILYTYYTPPFPQNKSIYLLDDILSSVDAPVARHIMRHCIHGFLAGRTVIMATSAISLLTRTDWVITMKGGTIDDQGTITNYVSYLRPTNMIELSLTTNSCKYDSMWKVFVICVTLFVLLMFQVLLMPSYPPFYLLGKSSLRIGGMRQQPVNQREPQEAVAMVLPVVECLWTYLLQHTARAQTPHIL